mmetsp:Transcript_20935/g.53021  ORF Transcript_20935/g.53021 Transcript_20935/m.53021 type:complete len:95 (-) Transcript_20935:152-436(-)
MKFVQFLAVCLIALCLVSLVSALSCSDGDVNRCRKTCQRECKTCDSYRISCRGGIMEKCECIEAAVTSPASLALPSTLLTAALTTGVLLFANRK